MSMHPVVTWLLDQPHNFVFPDFRMADRQDPGLPYMWDSGMDGGPPGGTSSDVPQMDASSGIPTSFPYGSNRLKSPHLNRPMSVPPPSAHMYNPQVPRSLDNPIPAHGGPMGISTSAPTASSTSSPLVVPHPVKMTRTNKTYHCRMCDQEFPTKSGMQRHARDIHMLQEKSHKCEKCFKSFPSSQQLTQHMLVHNNMRKYKCNYCEKSFKQLSHVQQHHRRHTGERPYKCMIEDCGKAFAQLSNLQQHQRNHENRKAQTERKPYLCTICDRRFATEASLNNHVSKLHAGIMMMRVPDRKCQICGKEYQSDERYIRHIHKLHPDFWSQFSGGRPLEVFLPPREVQHREKKYTCSICHKQYSHETGYLKHMASHPENESLKMRLWSCNVCQKVFTKETYLERHMEMKLDPEHSSALGEFRRRLIERQNAVQESLLTSRDPLPGPSGMSPLSPMSPLANSLGSPHLPLDRGHPDLRSPLPTSSGLVDVSNGPLDMVCSNGGTLPHSNDSSDHTPSPPPKHPESHSQMQSPMHSPLHSPLPKLPDSHTLSQTQAGPDHRSHMTDSHSHSDHRSDHRSHMLDHRSPDHRSPDHRSHMLDHRSHMLDHRNHMLDHRSHMSEHLSVGREVTSPHAASDLLRHPPISRSLSMDHGSHPHHRPSLSSFMPQLSSPLSHPQVASSLSSTAPHMTLPHTPIPTTGGPPLLGQFHPRPSLPPLPPFHGGIVQQRRGSVPMDHEEIVSALQCLAESMG